MSENLVTVGQFSDPSAAREAHTRLREAGIEAVLIPDRSDRHGAGALMGLKLQVPEDEAERAHGFLRGRPSASACPHCHSERFRPRAPMGLPWIFGLALTSVLPFTRGMLAWQCPDCGEVTPPQRWATNPRLKGSR